MRVLVLLLLSVQLAGCAFWLPISGDPDLSVETHWTHAQLKELIGKDVEEVTELLGGPRWTFSEHGRKHLIYSAHRKFGVWALIAQSGGWGGWSGEQTACYQLSFDESKKFYRLRKNTLRGPVTNLTSDPWIVDCRTAFWQAEELEDAKRDQELRAWEGDRDAVLVMAYEYKNPEPLRKLAESGDVDAAFLLAKKFGDLAPLEEFAQENGDVALAKILASDRQKYDLSWVNEVDEEAVYFFSRIRSHDEKADALMDLSK